MSGVDYVENFRKMITEGAVVTDVVEKLRDYRQRLDNIPSILPGHADAVNQADSLIEELSQTC